jgi:hypothetical protein
MTSTSLGSSFAVAEDDHQSELPHGCRHLIDSQESGGDCLPLQGAAAEAGRNLVEPGRMEAGRQLSLAVEVR